MFFASSYYKLILFSFICLPIMAAESSSELKDYFVSNILKGDVDKVVEHLEQFPKDIEYKNESKETTLMLAMKSNSVPMFIEILTRTKDLEEINKGNRTELYYVVGNKISVKNSLLFTQLLIERGIKFTINVFAHVIHNGASLELVKLFSEVIFKRDKLDINSKLGDFSLFNYAMDSKNPDKFKIAKYLINLGAKINQITGNTYTQLFASIEHADIMQIKFLLNNKADVNFIGKFSSHNRTPLTFAIVRRNVEKENNKYNMLYDIIELLIDNGASTKSSLDYQDYMRNCAPALYYAVEYADFDVVKLLVRKKANMNEVYNNQTALQLAKELYLKEKDNNKKEIYKKISEFLEDPLSYIINEDSLIATDALLYKYYHPNIADIVMTYIKGPVLPQDIEDNNLLIAFNNVINAIEENNNQQLIDCIEQNPKILLIKDNYGKTPLIYAIENENLFATVTILQKLKRLDLDILKNIKLLKQQDTISEDDKQKLEELKDKKIDNFKQNLIQALNFKNQITNSQIISILEDYKNSFMQNEEVILSL